MIFHITSRAEWDAALDVGVYVAASFEAEGFIHLSTRAQVLATAGRYYRGVPDLVLLAIDSTTLDASLLRYEQSTGGELFPHLYGALPVSSVVDVADLVEGSDGFTWPAALS